MTRFSSTIDTARLARALASAWPSTPIASTSGPGAARFIHICVTSQAAAAAGRGEEDRAPGLKATLLSILSSAPAPGLTAASVADAAGPDVSRTRVKKALQELKVAGRVVARPPAAAAVGGASGGGGLPASPSTAASKAFLFTARVGAAPAVGRAQKQA